MSSLGERLIEYEFGLTLFDWDNSIYLVVSLLLFFAARFVFPLPYWFILADGCFSVDTFKFNQLLVQDDNKAVALSFGSFVVSLALIMNGQISSGGDDKALNILYFVIWMAICFVLLLVSRFFNVYMIVRSKDCISSLVNSANIGVACVEAGSFIGSAWIIRSSTSGDISENFGVDILSTMLFYIMGQAIFTIYIFIFQRFVTRINLQTQLMNDNYAVGVSVGLNLIAVGYLISQPIRNSDSVLGYWVWVILGVLLLIGMRFITNRIILFGEDLDKEMVEDQNWGAALIEGAAAIMIVSVMDTFLDPDPNNVINCDLN